MTVLQLGWKACSSTLGEGPQWEVMKTGIPVLSAVLTAGLSPRATEHRPVFGTVAAGLGVAALFALPIAMGATTVSDLYRRPVTECTDLSQPEQWCRWPTSRRLLRSNRYADVRLSSRTFWQSTPRQGGTAVPGTSRRAILPGAGGRIDGRSS